MPDARPIAKGRLGKPVEFGYKAQVTDNDDGIIARLRRRAGQPRRRPAARPGRGTRHQADREQARDRHRRPQLRRAVHRRRPARRSGSATWSSRARANPARPARPPSGGRAFRRAVKWRTGSEGRISTLKRQYGWDRTRLDGTEGARTWTGYGVLAHNLVKISALAS